VPGRDIYSHDEMTVRREGDMIVEGGERAYLMEDHSSVIICINYNVILGKDHDYSPVVVYVRVRVDVGNSSYFLFPKLLC
jgi:hypothetical protein